MKKQERLRAEYTKATEEYEKNIRTMHLLDSAYQEVINAMKKELSKTKSENQSRLEAISLLSMKKANLNSKKRIANW